MSDSKVRNASKDPKAIHDACTFALKNGPEWLLKAEANVKPRAQAKALDICEHRVSRAAKNPNYADNAQKLLTCIDEYKTPEAQGRCLADVIWHAPKTDNAKLPSLSHVFGRSDQGSDNFPLWSLRLFQDK